MIGHIADKQGEGVSLTDLVAQCGSVEEDDVLQAAAFWAAKGVLAVDTSAATGERVFTVVEDQSASAAMMDTSTVEDDSADQVIVNI